ncbi:hypothetical protein [Cohnella terricola]|uniref:Uncharacterized protein n=1 Tax=Cohnella terricola TaxID=1289167 RepID=A0A559JAK2_9BACL|nr:hypothetical protein [Cohnella terricola]TVX96914.1 hypothetical protein FPZ45_20190 [Cohnella terricola]
MSSPYAAQQLTPIYQCDGDLHRTLQSLKDHLHQVCAHHANRPVRIETIDGDVFEGHIMHCDRGILYLGLSNEGYERAFFPGPVNPYSNFVLPLVLFNLLAISLI